MFSDMQTIRSSLQTPVKEAIFGSFLDVDPDQEISLRTLVCCLRITTHHNLGLETIDINCWCIS